MKKAACMVIVSRRRGELVYAAVSSPEKRPGWGLPGGKVDRGEKIHEAAIRECHEETGLLVIHSAGPLFSGADSSCGEFVVDTFLAISFTGRMRSSPEGRAGWVTRQELLDGHFGSYNQKVFKALDALDRCARITPSIRHR